MDLSACAQFRYEMVAATSNKKVAEIERSIKDDDTENAANRQPAALPFFKKVPMNLELYRDNDC